MKAIRTYETRSAWVWCTVDFVTDDQDWDSDPDQAAAFDRYSVYMRAQVLYRKPTDKTGAVDRFHVRAHPNLPRKVVFDEALRFLETLKTMYEL